MSPSSSIREEYCFYCPSCNFRNHIAGSALPDAACSNCGWKVRLRPFPRQDKFRCIFCGDEHFYLVKDFNRGLGFLIFLAGAVASIWTYGISLALAALVDAILYKKLPFLKVCYICSSEYRGVPIHSGDQGYQHPMGDLLRPIQEEWEITKKRQVHS